QLRRGADSYPQRKRRSWRCGRNHRHRTSRLSCRMTTVRVELPAKSYDVLVGPVEAGLERIRDLSHGSAPILVSEPRVFALHGARIAEQLGADPVIVPEGEAAKDWDVLRQLLSDLSERAVSRQTPIVALGGGSVGDVA